MKEKLFIHQEDSMLHPGTQSINAVPQSLVT
jgi:hypothetical protein